MNVTKVTAALNYVYTIYGTKKSVLKPLKKLTTSERQTSNNKPGQLL